MGLLGVVSRCFQGQPCGQLKPGRQESEQIHPGHSPPTHPLSHLSSFSQPCSERPSAHSGDDDGSSATMKLGPCVRLVPCEELLDGLPALQYISAGGMSTVYAGVWAGNVVAVKFVLSNELDPTSPAYRELYFCGHLRHPNIVQTYECRIAQLTSGFFSAHKQDNAPVSGDLSASPAQGDSMLLSPGNRHTSHAQALACDSFGCQRGHLPSSGNTRLHTMPDVLALLEAKPGQHLAVVIMEYCDRGTLAYWAHQGLFVYREGGWPWRYVYRALLRTAAEVAQAMLFMHAKDIVHADLKPLNVLVRVSAVDKRGFSAAVTDFGLAKLQVGERCPSTQRWSTLQYMAPEAFEGHCCKASDVYSFGIMLHEMFTGRQPYRGMSPGQIVRRVRQEHMRPVWPLESPPELVALATRCCHDRPEMRPTFEQVLSELHWMERELRSWYLQAKNLITSNSDVSRSNSQQAGAGTPPADALDTLALGSYSDILVASQRGSPPRHGEAGWAGPSAATTTGPWHRPWSRPTSVEPAPSSSLHLPRRGQRYSLDEAAAEVTPTEPLVPPMTEEEERERAAAIAGAADLVLREWQLRPHRWRPENMDMSAFAANKPSPPTAWAGSATPQQPPRQRHQAQVQAVRAVLGQSSSTQQAEPAQTEALGGLQAASRLAAGLVQVKQLKQRQQQPPPERQQQKQQPSQPEPVQPLPPSQPKQQGVPSMALGRDSVRSVLDMSHTVNTTYHSLAPAT